MKKLILFTALLFTVFSAKGEIFIGGTINIAAASKSFTSSLYGDDQKAGSFSVAPQIGFIINEKNSVGIELNYINEWSKTNDDDKESGTMFIAGPLYRLRFAQIKNFSFIAEAKLGIGVTGQDLPKSTICTLAIVPIIQYKLNNRCSLEAKINIASLAYVYQTTKLNEFE